MATFVYLASHISAMQCNILTFGKRTVHSDITSVSHIGDLLPADAIISINIYSSIKRQKSIPEGHDSGCEQGFSKACKVSA